MVKFPEPLAGPIESGPRYAIYFAPAPDTVLHGLAATWLGRDCVSGATLAQPKVPGMAANRIKEVTANPRRYGFHATLKPPFHLKPGTTVEDLLDASRTLARAHQPYEVKLVLRQFSDFFALMQGQSRTETRALAAAAVSELDRFRALPNQSELQRRRESGLSGAQESLLQRWGYPYVMNEFRFHMTLSQRVTDTGEVEMIRAALREHFAPALESPQMIDAIAVFREDTPGASFTQVDRFPLGNDK